MDNFDAEKWVTCKICKQSVILDTGMQSPAANWLEIHQRPCLAVFTAILPYVDEEDGTPGTTISFGEASEHMMEHASSAYMFEKDNELWFPYYTWMMTLYVHLMQNKELRNELVEKYRTIPKLEDIP
jgi:hypothetical protein